ncbi:UDP-N-acetylglucosamine 4,6-dehydratase (inverting) [Haematospirillum sp. H1815]|uniref:UDP-N-acetylglucosamine 4,6-dehydratase (inverting) n=1 Tax=Haematospirillum sp. H1815 TaxID=2723108 RepID=UPI001439719E|nr:UDP-N-acetylglucosamine 4,6-dehydratase (inverting) [Haematospirillum sp. H1815]NKD77419.1 UDP-N-acetylglucosamine 4,6-dehydratase (inverting) [Haematospirillum sp. H1815]
MHDPVPIRRFDSPSPDLDGASILVTGGTGSFGQQFVRTVLDRYRPRRLVVFSRDELKQSEMAAVFRPETHRCMRYFLGDVRDRMRLEFAMRNIDYVIHAAALKQVPAAEYNPIECVHTNIIGAENVVYAAIRAGVKKVVALSTDKAANPINLYGASKLASDKIFVAARHIAGGSPRFCVVRYGNVLGSRGSVVPFFLDLMAQGVDSLPVTDERMTRFWISLEQGVDFVLSSLAMMQDSEVFVPKIPSARVVDIAKWMAPNLTLRTVGIRPGEKLHEAMIPLDDARSTLELPDRYILLPVPTHSDTPRREFSGATPVDESFSYTSDKNNEWIDRDTFLAAVHSKFPDKRHLLSTS